MKIVGIWTVFIADMNSACKNVLISIFLLILLIRHNYLQFFHRLFPWIKLIFSKIWKFLILLYLSSFPSKKHVSLFFWYYAQEFLWKSQKINRNYQNYSFFCFFFLFFFFCIFHENRRIFNCFHCRYEFFMQKYPNKHIFVEYADKA